MGVEVTALVQPKNTHAKTLQGVDGSSLPRRCPVLPCLVEAGFYTGLALADTRAAEQFRTCPLDVGDRERRQGCGNGRVWASRLAAAGPLDACL